MPRKRVAYFHDREGFSGLINVLSCLQRSTADIGSYTYGLGHTMKPQRMKMTHELVSAYDMMDKMHVLVRFLFSSVNRL